MKNNLRMLSLAGLMILAQACIIDDDNQITIQEHDKNQMMSIMHSMMDEMMEMEMSHDPDHDFAMMMKIHHQGAIDMANAELEDGKDSEMRAMAQSIKAAQQAEIVELDAFLAIHNPHRMSMEFHDQMMKEMEESGRQADLQVINGNIDHDFAMLMIGHHHSAIENSRLVLIYGHDESMIEMANKIITTQQEEIRAFQNWLLSKGHK